MNRYFAIAFSVLACFSAVSASAQTPVPVDSAITVQVASKRMNLAVAPAQGDAVSDFDKLLNGTSLKS